MRSPIQGIKTPALFLSLIAAISISLLLSQDLPAADWKVYAGTDEGLYYYDTESLTYPAKDVVHLRHKATFSESGIRRLAETFGKEYEDLVYSISVREINCAERKIRSLGVSYFSKNGNTLDAAIDARTEWHAIEQTAVIEGLYQIVCK